MPLTLASHRSRQKRLQTPHGQIAYVDEGDGPVILLVHGVPTSSWLFRKLIPELVSQGFRVIAPDLLGYGASDKLAGYEIYDPAHQAQRLIYLMEFLNIDSWNHLCHDVGGVWTWEMLKHVPLQVERLILLNTIIYEEGFKPPMRFHQNVWTRFYVRLYYWRLTAGMMIDATMKNGLNGLRLTKVEKEGYVEPMCEGGYRGIYHFFTQTCHNLEDYRSVLQNLRVPTMVIWGAKDPMLHWKPQADRVMADLDIQPENVHILPEASHFIPEANSEEIGEWIGAFLRPRLSG